MPLINSRFLIGSVITLICSSCTVNVPNPKQMDSAGESFAKDSVQQIGQHWDTQALTSRADPSLATLGDPSALLKIFADKLGTISKINSIKRMTYKEFAGLSVNRPDYVALYQCDAQYTLAPAAVSIGVMHKDNKWLITNFNIDSQVLKNLNQDEQAESKKFVQQVTPQICRNLSMELLQQNADADLAKELSNNLKAMAAKSSFMIASKALGQFKSCADPVLRNSSFVRGQFVYIYAVAADYEHGKATVSILVDKYNGQWKIRAFNVQGHNP